jgi:hypothetical protein
MHGALARPTARRWRNLLACGALASAVAMPQWARADAVQSLAQSSCQALQTASATVPGDGPMLLPSYPSLAAGSDQLRALQQVAFVYDNALAGIALTACGQPAQARRIADALLLASAHDPSFRDGRLRNAYRSGTPVQGKIDPPGYWDSKGNFWNQDAYQVGTATGNVAWAALLYLTVYQSTHDARYLDGAIAQLRWIGTQVNNATVPAAYDGGFYGYDNAQKAQHWKSTEHNIDVYAAASWAMKYRPDPALARQAKQAGSFVTAMWSPEQGRFFIGTLDDGKTISRDKSGLDSQVWPLLAFSPLPSGWNKVWQWVDSQHRSGDGYGYRRQPDGIWTEGSAQVASAMRWNGVPVPARLWQTLSAQRSPDGLLFATPQPRIGTDLAIGPDSTYADFFYYHLPHLGATAWASLAATGWNPFLGREAKPAGSTP